MKTKELVDRINSKTNFLATSDYHVGIKICTSNDHVVKQVCCIHFDTINVDAIELHYSRLYKADCQYSLEDIGELYKLVKEYVDTPLKDRNDTKYYRVKVFNHDMGYLNYDKSYKRYIIADCDESWYKERFNAKFTDNN